VALRPLSTRLLAAILVAVGATRLAVVAVERQEGVDVAHLGGAIVAHPSRASLGGAKSASRRGSATTCWHRFDADYVPRRRTRTPLVMGMAVTATGTPTPAQRITLPVNLTSSSSMISTTELIRSVLQVGQV
jgi:hypothetical protein